MVVSLAIHSATQDYIPARICLKGMTEGSPASRDYQKGFSAKDMMSHLAAAVASEQSPGPILPMTTQALDLYKQVLANLSTRCSNSVTQNLKVWALMLHRSLCCCQ